jgi:hypothetical protein
LFYISIQRYKRYIVFFLPENLDIHDVTGHGEIDEDDHPIHMGQRLAFGGDGLDGDVLQFQVDFFSAHSSLSYNLQIYSIFMHSSNLRAQGIISFRIT